MALTGLNPIMETVLVRKKRQYMLLESVYWNTSDNVVSIGLTVVGNMEYHKNYNCVHFSDLNITSGMVCMHVTAPLHVCTRNYGLALPGELWADDTRALEPRLDSPLNSQSDSFTPWPHQPITLVENHDQKPLFSDLIVLVSDSRLSLELCSKFRDVHH